MIITIEPSEIGRTPIMGNRKFIPNPVNIKNDMLNPTEYKMAFITLSFIFRIVMIRIPGTNVR